MTNQDTKKKFSVFHGLFCPFFSKAFYVDVARNWTYHAYLFLVMLTIGLTIPSFSHLLQTIDENLDEMLPQLTQSLPTIHIKNGQAEVEGIQGPTQIVLKKSALFELILLIDLETEKEAIVKNIKPNQQTLYLVLTKDTLLGVEPSGEFSELPLSTFARDITISKDNIRELSGRLMRSLMYLAVPFLLSFLLIFRLFLALIMALLADILKAEQVELKFSKAMSLGIMTMTPAMVLSHLQQYFEIHLPFSWAIYIVISIFYLRFALKGLEEAEKTTAAVTTSL